jgi:AcrR family transcriptional regulator
VTDLSDQGAAIAFLPSPTPPAGLEACDDVSGGDATGEVDLLITATWTVAARIGSFEPSVRDILQEAGISTKAFYRHFRSKDDLLLVALDAGSVRLAEYIENQMTSSSSTDHLVRIATWIESFVRHSSTSSVARRTFPLTLGVLGVSRLANVYPDQFDHSKELVMAPLQREIADAVAEGTAHSPDPEKDAWIIFGYTMDAIRQHRVHQTEPSADNIRQLVAFTYRALGATPAV